MPEKMGKCRNCQKERPMAEIEDPEKDCACGWNEAKAKAEVRKRKLLGDIAKEEEQGQQGPPRKGLFFQ